MPKLNELIISYLSVFSPNAGKYGPEKLRIRARFTQCLVSRFKSEGDKTASL